MGASATVLDQSLTTAELALRPFTVIRTVGSLMVANDQFAATESAVLAMGMGVFNAPAVAAGVASLPTPITDEASDLWFVYEAVPAWITVATAVSIATPGATIRYFDQRAMRKVEDGQDIGVLLENASGTDGVRFWLKFRLLIKMH